LDTLQVRNEKYALVLQLLNHSPLIVAEQFGTLETLYPRIDLGWVVRQN
jgi:alkanesulfonate monooxygenase SsuD/methylene tetrahydromethanopterin reductase-like flavin-dependent oxidoreductase (luciferase family)